VIHILRSRATPAQMAEMLQDLMIRAQVAEIVQRLLGGV